MMTLLEKIELDPKVWIEVEKKHGRLDKYEESAHH